MEAWLQGNPRGRGQPSLKETGSPSPPLKPFSAMVGVILSPVKILFCFVFVYPFSNIPLDFEFSRVSFVNLEFSSQRVCIPHEKNSSVITKNYHYCINSTEMLEKV